MDSLWPPGGLQKSSLKNSALIHYSGVRFPKTTMVGVDRPIIGADIKHFKNRFAENFFFLCKQTYYLQVTLFIGE